MRTNSLTAGRKHPAGRRHPLASIALITIGLLATGGAYALMTTTASAETTAAAQSSISEGQKLFASNCATCHGRSVEGTEMMMMLATPVSSSSGAP